MKQNQDDLVKEGMRVGKYELKKQLGRGGFGMVFRARDTALGRDCALKFLLPEHTEKSDLLQRFLQEARTAATIVHGGIVTVYECGVVEDGEAEGMAFIAMELLQGESLADRVGRGPLPPDLAIEVARQVASALGAAHAAGVVHRDLKPDNVWLVPDVASAIGLRVKVLDFGIAKLAEGHAMGGVQTQTIQIFGTPHYMSPEQCRSTAGVDGRTDIYALGVMLFEMLAGGRPFEGVPAVLIASHQLLPPPALRTVVPAVPVELDGLVSVMLAKEADERPSSMDDVMARLEPMRRPSGSLSVAPGSMSPSGNNWRPATPPPVTPAPAPRTPVPGLPSSDAVATRDLRPSSAPPMGPATSSPATVAGVPSAMASAPQMPSGTLPPAHEQVANGTAPPASSPGAPQVAPTARVEPAARAEPTARVEAPRSGRPKLWIALSLVAVAGIAAAVIVKVTSKKDSAPVATASSAEPPRDAGVAVEPKGSGSAPSGSGAPSGPGKITPGTKPDPTKVYAMPVLNAPFVGALAAPVTLVVGTDYACVPCGEVQATLAQVRNKYAHDVLRIVYKPNLVHAASRPSAYGACAAGRQKQLLPFEKELWSWDLATALKDGDKLGDNFDPAGCWETRKGCPYMNETAEKLGLDADKFAEDLRACARDVEAAVADWRRFGVTTTPSFFVNGRYLVGAVKLAVFERLIDAELALANERIAAGAKAQSYYRDWVLAKGLTP